jgi:hypothetical protein
MDSRTVAVHPFPMTAQDRWWADESARQQRALNRSQRRTLRARLRRASEDDDLDDEPTRVSPRHRRNKRRKS